MSPNPVAAPNPLPFLAEETQDWRRRGLERTLRTLTPLEGAWSMVDGRRALVMCSNSYLGLHRDPRLVRAAIDALQEFGTGATGSRLVSGTQPLHEELEAAIARLKGTQDAVLFGTGYLANLGTVAALAGTGDLILSDRLNHASLVDACRHSRATVAVYDHADPEAVARILEEQRPDARRCLILTDGVFGMDGDIAPLAPLARLAARHDAILYVDDAHGTGVLGPDGSGSVREAGLSGRDVSVQMGTLSKALASQGGFIAGSRELCHWIRNRARTFVYSTAPPPASMAAALAALRVAEAEPERRRRLRDLSSRLRAGLRRAGFAPVDGPAPIVPILVGSAERSVAVSDAMLSRSVFTPAIRPPTVPEGTSRLRLTVTAAHTPEDVDLAVHVLATTVGSQEVTARAPLSS